MAHSDSISLLTLLQAWIPDFLLEHFIAQSGWVQRDRKLDPIFFVWTLILGWSSGAERSIASLHRTYQRMLGCDCDRAAFYRRFTPELVVVFEQLWTHLTAPDDEATELGPFADVLALDATILSLWTALADRLPAYHKGQAAHKLQLLISLSDYKPNKMLLDAGTGSDHQAWKMLGPWLSGKLVLCDLGYYNFWFFHRIQAHGGFFLTRLKKNCALTILEDTSPGPGRRKSIVGLDFSQALEGMQRQLVECIVEVPVSLRSGRQVRYRWRAIAVWNAEQKRYHTYLTNCSEALIRLEDVSGLYALRWQIEVMFKGLKSVGRLHHLPSRNPDIVKALVLAALLFVLLSSWLKEALRHVKKLENVGILRWLKVLREWADVMLEEVASQRPGWRQVDKLDLFITQLQDPNVTRARSMLNSCFIDHFA